MKNIFNRIKIATVAFLVAIIGLPIGVINSVLAANDGYVDYEDAKTYNNDKVKLTRTAKKVDGVANQWEVELEAQVPFTFDQTSTVIIIDRSSSMADETDKIVNARILTNTLVSNLLASSSNKVAIVMMDDTAPENNSDPVKDKIIDLTNNRNLLTTLINGQDDNLYYNIKNISGNDGAFFQAALEKAVEILDGDTTAKNKNIVLISDSVPNYSYKMNITSPSCANEQWGTNQYGNKLLDTTPHKGTCNNFNYTALPVGAPGTNIRTDSGLNLGGLGRIYYNHGNAAIAAVKAFKADTVTNNHVYAMAFEDTHSDGKTAMASIASENGFFNIQNSTVDPQWSKALSAVTSIIKNTFVKDEIAAGFKAIEIEKDGNETLEIPDSGKIVDNTIEWSPRFECANNVCTASIWYKVEIDSEKFTASDTEDFYKLSDAAYMTYKFEDVDMKSDFPVVKLNPVLITINKYLLGDKRGEYTFDIDLIGKDILFKNQVKVKNESDSFSGAVTLAEVLPTGKYEALETETSSGIFLDYYLTKIFYDNNENLPNIEIKTDGEDHSIDVYNEYWTTNIEVSTNWDDTNNQDKLRPTEYEVTLLGNDEVVEIRTIKESEDWATIFEGLHKYYKGEPIKYTLQSAEVPEYKTTVNGDMESGFEVTHLHISNLVNPNVPVKKPDTGLNTITSDRTSGVNSNFVALTSVALGAVVVLVMAIVAKIKKH